MPSRSHVQPGANAKPGVMPTEESYHEFYNLMVTALGMLTENKEP